MFFAIISLYKIVFEIRLKIQYDEIILELERTVPLADVPNFYCPKCGAWNLGAAAGPILAAFFFSFSVVRRQKFMQKIKIGGK